MVDDDKNLHNALVCVICDAGITGIERICHESSNKLLRHKDNVSAQLNNNNNQDKLNSLLVMQYNIDYLPGFLLPPRSSKKEG